MLKKLNFWSKSYPNPTPFLGQYDSNHVQCGYVLVQYGHVLSLHLLLDPSSMNLPNRVHVSDPILPELFTLSRHLCVAICKRRSRLLSEILNKPGENTIT